MQFASDNNWMKIPFISIDVNNKTFTGNSGCNDIRGKLIINNSYLAFDKNIISTKMACVYARSKNDENSFLAALLKINKFSINKDELELGQGEIVIMKFKRK
jgi:heat shock protein HslJ